MKIMVLRNVFIGGKVFAEGKPADVSEKDAKVLIAMKKAKAITAEDAEAVEKALREDSEKALTGKLLDTPEDKGGKKK